MATTNTISQQLLDLLATRNFHPEMLDKMGKPSNAEDAKTFTFDYISGSGKNYGTMVIVLDSDNEMKIMYGDNLGRTMEGDDKSEFFDFLQHLNQKATSNRWTHSIQDISQLKHPMQGMAAIQEGLFEGYYGTRKVSYAGEPTQARLQIVHSQPLGEGDARYRHIDRMFIETAEGEKFKLGFKSLNGARAMLEHVRQGGKPYDIRGCHITETVNEIAVLSRFNRASANRILEGVTQELVTEAQQYYQALRENLKHMASGRGYTKYFESWHPATINEQEGVVDNIKTLFIEQSIDSRIEAALPLLAKIQQRGNEMKEADIFENWINNLAEGTWTLPETPEQLDKLKTLMTKELIVGPDATNATEQLYDLVGDDILFDRLNALADQDPRANAWNDTEVMQRLAELGIEMPEPTAPGNPAEPQTGATAPVAASVAPNPAPQQPVAEGDDLATFEDINSIRNLAGLPVTESVLTDSTGSTLDHICNRFGKEVRNFETSGEMSDDLYHALYDYYFDDMPYGTKKARDGDPYEYVADRFAQDRGLDEGWKGAIAGGLAGGALGSVVPALGTLAGAAAGAYAGHKLGDEGFKDPDAEYKKAQKLKQTPPVAEGSCNMTAEGQYCPEHGLMECGMGMAEDIMGEGVVGNMFNKAKSMFTKPATTPAAAPAPVVPNAATQARIAAAPQGYDPNTGKPQVAAKAAPGAVAKGGTMDMTKKVVAPAANPAAAPAAAPAPSGSGKVQGIKSNVDVNTLQKFNGIVDVTPKIKPQIKDAGGVTWTKTTAGWTDGKRSIDPKDSTYQSFDDAWRVANGAQPGNVGVPGAQQAPAVAEGNNDPMNYNGAITGSYYESREGDALLARIKSLALLK